jgi:hypothetical protein
MFCSEFVIICYEAASLNLYDETLFGTNPRGMSPMEMENIINSRPDKMMLVGRIENPIDIVFKAVKDGIEEYKKTLRGGFFRRPSRESVDAFFILRGFLDVGPTVAIIFVAAHSDKTRDDRRSHRPSKSDCPRRDADWQIEHGQSSLLTSTFNGGMSAQSSAASIVTFVSDVPTSLPPRAPLPA